MSTTTEASTTNSTTTITDAVQENDNENKKPDPEQLFRIHGYSIQKDEENKKKKNYYIHSLTFKKLTSPLVEFEEVLPVRLERRKFDSFDAMNRDANRIGVYLSKVDNDITHLNDTKIMQFLNDRANMREIPGKNPVSELFGVLGLNQFQHAAIKEKGEDTETREKKGTLDQSYQIAASGTNDGYYTVHRIIDYESTGFCNRRAEGTNVWLSCCPLQPPERLKDFGQRLLYSSFVFREDKDAKLKHDAGTLMVNAAIGHAALQEEKGGLAEAVRIKDLEIPISTTNVVPETTPITTTDTVVPLDATTTTTAPAEPSKLELGKEEGEEDPLQAKYDAPSTYNETMALLKETTQRLDAFEEKKEKEKDNENNNNPVIIKNTSQIQQTAAARDYYQEASFRHFTETVNNKFWQTIEKRRKWK